MGHLGQLPAQGIARSGQAYQPTKGVTPGQGSQHLQPSAALDLGPAAGTAAQAGHMRAPAAALNAQQGQHPGQASAPGQPSAHKQQAEKQTESGLGQGR